MNARESLSFLTLWLLLFAVGCGRAPQKELLHATAEIHRAREIGADRYAPDAYRALEEAHEAAAAELRAQKDSLFFARDYTESRRLLREVSMAAQKAAAAATVVKLRVRRAAAEALMEARVALTSLEEAEDEAPASRSYRPNGLIEELEEKLREARRDFAAEDYIAAALKAKEITELVRNAEAERRRERTRTIA